MAHEKLGAPNRMIPALKTLPYSLGYRRALSEVLKITLKQYISKSSNLAFFSYAKKL
jgi:hypothetical protein